MRNLKPSGITLLELMVVLAIISILLLIAIPSLSHLFIRHQKSTQINQLADQIYYLRSEAMTRSSPIVFCKSNDKTTCSGEWSDGQIAFIDITGTRQRDPDDILIRSWGPLKQAKLQWRGFVSNDYLLIHPSGLGNAMAGSFHYQHQSDQTFKPVISLNRVGRVRVIF